MTDETHPDPLTCEFCGHHAHEPGQCRWTFGVHNRPCYCDAFEEEMAEEVAIHQGRVPEPSASTPSRPCRWVTTGEHDPWCKGGHMVDMPLPPEPSAEAQRQDDIDMGYIAPGPPSAEADAARDSPEFTAGWDAGYKQGMKDEAQFRARIVAALNRAESSAEASYNILGERQDPEPSAEATAYEPSSDRWQYNPEVIAVAVSRGFDAGAHDLALINDDEDAIGLTHPYNWLTEDEVETA